MPKIQQSEIRKKDIYTIRDIRNNDVKRVIVPNGLQLGVDGFSQDAVPLRLVSGALKNSPEPGGVEYDGTDIFYTTDALERRNLSVLPNANYYSTQIQTNTLSNESIFTYNNTAYESGFTLTGGTKIYAEHSAIYNVAFSVQFNNTDSSEHIARVWLKKDGSNIGNTRSDITIIKSQGGSDGHAIMAANFFVEIEAGHYIELAWSATNAAVTAEYLTDGVSPTSPASPSVVVTLNRVGY